VPIFHVAIDSGPLTDYQCPRHPLREVPGRRPPNGVQLIFLPRQIEQSATSELRCRGIDSAAILFMHLSNLIVDEIDSFTNRLRATGPISAALSVSSSSWMNCSDVAQSGRVMALAVVSSFVNGTRRLQQVRTVIYLQHLPRDGILLIEMLCQRLEIIETFFEAELSFHASAESLLYFRLPDHHNLGSEDPRFHPFDTYHL
jgi:hypothetical protein